MAPLLHPERWGIIGKGIPFKNLCSCAGILTKLIPCEISLRLALQRNLRADFPPRGRNSHVGSHRRPLDPIDYLG